MRLASPCTAKAFYFISIHAPYKRVRPMIIFSSWKHLSISIHAPYKRVRLHMDSVLKCRKYGISIHAPYKRVRRLPRRDPRKRLEISIHAPYKRVRPICTVCGGTLTQFQSTHPTRECDTNLPFIKRVMDDFNPRTLQESATAIYSKKITFSQYIGLKILIRNKKYPSLK